ncbi:MAG: hypothetical protein IJB56_08520 [Alistipes sp.]|nr:hypothetical protein [Alistipes sp.]
MRHAVDALLDSYPEAKLQDVYKSMFQGRFGVAHMLGSREAVEAYIEREVQLCEGEIVKDGGVAECYLEPCGWRGDYVRVDLRAVCDGVMTVKELADIFVCSAAYAPLADDVALEVWAEEWNTILEVCHPRLRVIDGFERDSMLLAELIAGGEYVVHHSRRYNECYAPHYRIVHCSLLEE